MPTGIPRRLLSKAITEGSLPGLKDALVRQRESDDTRYSDLAHTAFKRALSHNLHSFVAYLLRNENSHVDLTDISLVASLWNAASIPSLELLVAHGWDINQQHPKTPTFKGTRLIDSGHVLRNYELVVWMVEHGAIIDDGDPEAETSWPSPLLETCAAFGTVKSFMFLREKGAKLGRKTLHRASLVAAELGAEPSTIADATPTTTDQVSPEEEARKLEAAAMLRYLVDEVGLDLNRIETYSPWCEGPPISFAASKKSGARVVRWLLHKGADPTVVVPGIDRDTQYWAVSSGNEEAERLIQEWKKKRDKN